MATRLMSVTVAPLAGEAKTIRLSSGSTLRAALLRAGYSEDDLGSTVRQTRVNNQRRALDAKLPAGAFITIAGDVQGGLR